MVKNSGRIYMALSVKELQIGDWVIYNHNVFKDDPYLPGNIPLSNDKIRDGEDIDLACEGCYTPIPITDDILEVNGFIREGGVSRNRAYKINVQHWSEKNKILNGVGKEGNPINIPDIIYVHELQHALRLCGLDELANNFKV